MSQRLSKTVRRPWIRQATTAAVLLCTVPLIGASCLSSGDGDSDNRSSDRRDDLSDSRIPSNARKVAGGRGVVSFRAASDGRVYVYDATDREVVYTEDLRDGDYVAVDPAENRILVNDRRAEKIELASKNTHNIYFDGRRTSSRDDDLGSDRDISRPVPDGAKVVAEARGKDLSFKADDDGKAYLYDATESKLVKTYTVRRGQRLTVSPANGIVAVDGKTVAKDQPFDRRTTYRLLFAR